MKFIKQEQGSLGLILGLAAFVVIGILVVTIDLGKTQTGSSKMNNATDSVALATASWIMKGKLAQADTNPNWLTWAPSDKRDQAIC